MLNVSYGGLGRPAEGYFQRPGHSVRMFLKREHWEAAQKYGDEVLIGFKSITFTNGQPPEFESCQAFGGNDGTGHAAVVPEVKSESADGSV